MPQGHRADPKWQTPHSARCLNGAGRRRFCDEVLPARGSANVSAKSLPQHQKPTKRIPKASQNPPKILPNPPQILPRWSKMELKWHSFGRPPKSVPKRLVFDPQSSPGGSQREPKTTKHYPKTITKHRSRKTSKHTCKKLPTDSKREPTNHFLGDFGWTKGFTKPKTLICTKH